MEIWFDKRPANTKGALFFPATIKNPDAVYLTRSLGHLCHRLRMPKFAQSGFNLINKNNALLHYVEDLCQPNKWLDLCLQRIVAELSI